MAPNHFTYASALSISHFNCKGIYSKLQELRNYLYDSSIDILCISETWLSKREPVFKNYHCAWQHRGRFGGGVGIVGRCDISFERVHIPPYAGGVLEFVCIRVLTASSDWVYVLCVYNPCKTVTQGEFAYLLDKLGNKHVIMGDFNAHAPGLDGKYHRGSNTTGLMLEREVLNQNVAILNPPDTPTYIDYRSGLLSCLDLCLVSSTILPNSEFTLGPDLGSDHRVIEMSVCKLPLEEH